MFLIGTSCHRITHANGYYGCLARVGSFSRCASPNASKSEMSHPPCMHLYIPYLPSHIQLQLSYTLLLKVSVFPNLSLSFPPAFTWLDPTPPSLSDETPDSLPKPASGALPVHPKAPFTPPVLSLSTVHHYTLCNCLSLFNVNLP